MTATVNRPTDHDVVGYQVPTVGGASSSDDGQSRSGNQALFAVVAPTRPAAARPVPTPNGPAPLLDGPATPATVNRPTDHTSGDTHGEPVGGASSSDDGQDSPGIQTANAVVAPTRPAAASDASTPSDATPLLDDPVLSLYAETLSDAEALRCAVAARVEVMTRQGVDKDGTQRGFGLPPDNPAVMRLADVLAMVTAAELSAKTMLENRLKLNPLHPWITTQKGIGAKQAARLLAVIGDPYIRAGFERDSGAVEPARPRTVSQLWAYCGYRPGQRRRRGERANWSSEAKKRAYLIAESCVKQLAKPCARPADQTWAEHAPDCHCSPYRVLYDQARENYEGSLHHEDCARCGPAGKPAPAGSPRSAAHCHAMALRRVAKRVLRNLWREAKRLHELETPS